MPYSYFDHEADIGIIGEGASLEEAMQEGAQAMLDLICDHRGRGDEEIAFEIEAPDLENLWISFLNELLARMDIQDLFLSSCAVNKVEHAGKVYHLKALARGLPRTADVATKSEVKAATYCRVEVVNQPGRYKAQCVVDI